MMRKVFYLEEFKKKRKRKSLEKFIHRRKWALITLFILLPINIAIGMLVSIEAAAYYALFVLLLPFFLLKEIKSSKQIAPIPFKGRE